MIEKTAEWAPHPITERELAQERKRQLGKRRVGCALALVLPILCPCSFFFETVTHFSYPPALAATLLVAIAGLTFETVRRTVRIADLDNRRDQALHSEYRSVPGSWLVELTIYQGGTSTGKDRGMVWFEDGALFFIGSRTSFGIAPGAVRKVHLSHRDAPDIQSTLTLTLNKQGPAGNLAVGFDPTRSERFGRSSEKVMRGLGLLIADWWTNETRSDTQWPPIKVGPDMPSRRLLLFRALANTVFWVAALAGASGLVLIEGYQTLPTLVFAGIIISFCPELIYPRRRWLSWRDRRRLDRWNP